MMATVKKKGQLQPLATKIEVANGVYSRMKGLMFRNGLAGADGLLIHPCNSIHTFFMRFPIDVVFLGSEGKVVKVIRNMPPWRLSWIYFSARSVLEMAGGTLPADIHEGDELEVACTS